METTTIIFGIFGLLGGLMVKIVYDWLKSGKNGILSKNVEEIKQTVSNSWALQNVRNEDGVPVWYLPKQLKETMKEVVHNTERSNNLLEQILIQLKGRNE